MLGSCRSLEPHRTAFVHFTDESRCLYANIFTFSRTFAMILVIGKFSDCLDYISSINIHEQYF